MLKKLYYLVLIAIFFGSCIDIFKEKKEKKVEINVDKIEQSLNAKINEVEKILRKSRSEVFNILRNNKSIKPIYDENVYSRAKGDFLTDRYHMYDTNYFVPGKPSVDGSLKEYLQISEHFEKIFKNNKRTQPDLGWQYVLNYEHKAMRVYPWTNPSTLTKKDIEWDNFLFYNMTIKNKDKNKILCTETFSFDVGGLGKITSCTLPIVFNGKDYGLIGIDVVCNNSFRSVRSLLGNNLSKFAFIVNKNKVEILKPNFVDYLYKKPINLDDFSYATSLKIWKLNDLKFRAIYRKLNVQYQNLELMIMEKI